MQDQVLKNHNELVSVIIPTYNCDRYICQAIDSVLAQSYPEIEIIIVDDGSTDMTGMMIARYFDFVPEPKFPIFYYPKTNNGTASALNFGISKSRGSWIKWLSADDMLYPYCIEKMMQSVRINENRTNRIFYTDYDMVDEDGTKLAEHKDPDTYEWSNEKIRQTLFDHFFGNASSSLIHKDVFAKCGIFDESLPYAEDYEFWLRASLIYEIELCHISQTLLQYRIHQDQLTKKIGDKIGPINRLIKDKILSQLPVDKQLLYAKA